MKVFFSTEQLHLFEMADETKPFLPQLLIRHPELAIRGDDDLINDFSSACEDLLNRIGFDENYNPNADGRLLEKLIDDLFE